MAFSASRDVVVLWSVVGGRHKYTRQDRCEVFDFLSDRARLGTTDTGPVNGLLWFYIIFYCYFLKRDYYRDFLVKNDF